MTVLLIVLLFLAGVGGFSVLSYNRFVRQQQLVEESWRQVDVELRRRADLVARATNMDDEEALCGRARVFRPRRGFGGPRPRIVCSPGCTMVRAMSTSPLDVECPRCHATRGKSCKTADRVKRKPHQRRVKTAAHKG